MILKSTFVRAAVAALLVLTVVGCARDAGNLKPAPASTEPLVFDDTFAPNMDFQAFAGSRLDALSIDGNEHYAGTASLKAVIPAGGPFAGGAFTTGVVRDLTGYNALTFYAKASVPSVLDIAGLGNDNTGTSKYQASWSNIALTTSWQKFVIPIPRPDRLTFEGGLFFFAEGAEGSGAHSIWFDEVRFESITAIANPRPVMANGTAGTFVGASVGATGCQTTFSVAGVDQVIAHFPGYFTFVSSNTSAVTGGEGTITAVGAGTAVISAKLNGVDASGQITVNVVAPPTDPAPTPTVPGGRVISLFSDSYSDVAVDTWSADWDLADLKDLTIKGNAVKAYTNLQFAGIEFTSHRINATLMTQLHLDVWVPTAATIKVKLVDFGPNGTYDNGGDDSQSELSFNASSTPALTPGEWAGLDIPLGQFSGLTGRANLAQLIVSGQGGTAFLDNIYFNDLEPPPPGNDPVVFDDDFGSGVDFQAFSGSKLDALSIDAAEHYQGSSALKVVVPGTGGVGYAGGAFVAGAPRDLSAYNALTFWAKASVATAIDVVGLGNDNTGTSKYEARWANVPVTTTWRKYVIPIPRADRLTAEKGLFFFAQGPKGPAEQTLWFDEVKFEMDGGIADPRPAMATAGVSAFVGSTVVPTGCQTTYSVSGADQRIDHLPGYFDFASNNGSVVSVVNGVITAVGAGNAVVTGTLNGQDVSGQLVVTVTAPPATPAPTPTLPAADVISLFSNAYVDQPVDTWSADWDMADVALMQIAGNDTRVWRNLVFAGIEFTTHQVDAAAMNYFHLDVWVPGGSSFKVKLVDFGTDGLYGGGDDREHELTFTPAGTPHISIGAWAGLDIPLTSFSGLTTRGHLAQLIFSGDVGTVYVDNIYFHK